MTIGPPAWRAALDDHVEALAWSPDGTRLAAGSLAGDAVLLDAAGDVTAKLASHPIGRAHHRLVA